MPPRGPLVVGLAGAAARVHVVDFDDSTPDADILHGLSDLAYRAQGPAAADGAGENGVCAQEVPKCDLL